MVIQYSTVQYSRQRPTQKSFIYRLLARHYFLPRVAGSRQVTRLEAEKYVPDRLWYCPSSAAKPVFKSKHQLRPGPVDTIEGGIPYINGWLESYYDPQEGHPGQHAYTFLIRILSSSLTSVSIFSVCYYSSVSISMDQLLKVTLRNYINSVQWMYAITPTPDNECTQFVDSIKSLSFS